MRKIRKMKDEDSVTDADLAEMGYSKEAGVSQREDIGPS